MNFVDLPVPPRGHLLRLLPTLTLLSACAGADGSAPDPGPVTTIVATGASNPTVALDPHTGVRYVAWIGTSGNVSDVYAASASAGDSAYRTPGRVNDRAGDAAPHEQAPAQVAVGPEGDVYVLWQNNTPVEGRRFPASDLRFARSGDGGRTWSPAITVNDDAGGPPSSHTFHDLAVAADGTIYVSWIDSRVRDLARANQGQASHASGSPHSKQPGHRAEMGDESLPGSEIRVARSADGGRSFGPSVVVDTNSCPCCRTSLAVGPNGGVYVAWRKIYPGNIRDVVVARSEPGALAFSEPVRVHEDGWVFPGCPHAGPFIAVDQAGRLHVGWYTGREDRQGLWYAVSDPGGRSFDAPHALLTDDWVPPSQVKLGAAGESVWIAWEDRRSETRRWLLARADEAGGLHTLEGAGQPGGLPAVAAAKGMAALAWLDQDAVRTRRIGGFNAVR